MVGKVFGDFHAPYTLKNLSCGFRKSVLRIEIVTLHFFLVAVKSRRLGYISLPSFLYNLNI